MVYVIIIYLLAAFIFNLGLIAYYYIDLCYYDGYTKNRLYEFLKNLFLWELLFFVVVLYIFYRLFLYYLRHKKETEQIFNLLLKAISHRFGNFISIQKLNINLLRANNNPIALRRLEGSLNALEEDYRQIICVLENFGCPSSEIKKVNLTELIYNILSRFDSNDYTVYLRILYNIEVYAPLIILRTILFLLLENSFKYVNSFLYIRVGICRKNIYIFLANDIKTTVPRGSGIGLKIALLLTEKIGWHLKIKKGVIFSVLLYRSF